MTVGNTGIVATYQGGSRVPSGFDPTALTKRGPGRGPGERAPRGPESVPHTPAALQGQRRALITRQAQPVLLG